MAISDIKEYAHLSSEDVEQLGAELDAIRRDVVESLGEADAGYIRHTIAFQRILDAAARVVIQTSRTKIGCDRGRNGPRHRQERREHGDRAQRRPTASGIG